MSGLLPARTVDVWVAKPEDRRSPRWPDHLALLTAEELERSHSFHFGRDRELYVTAHALARIALGSSTGGPCGADDVRARGGERPVALGECDIDLSITHTDGLVAVAVGRSVRCGVDAELIGPRAVRSEAVLHPAEIEALGKGNGLGKGDVPAAFHRYWTLKEAISKVSGQGLSMPFGDVQLSPLGAEPSIVSGHEHIDLDDPERGWSLAYRQLGGGSRWSIAVAAKGASPHGIRIRWIAPGWLTSTAASRPFGVAWAGNDCGVVS